MSITSINSMSYSSMTSGTMNIKGQSSSSTASQEESKSSSTSSSTDSVSLSTYSIDGNTVTKSEFEQYDADGNGTISASELSAYKKAQETESSDSSSETDETDTENSEIISQLTMSSETTDQMLLNSLGSNVDTFA